MPAQSEAQRRWAFGTKGKAWAEAHHFDNKGKLPKRVKGGANESRMTEGSFSVPLDGRRRKMTFNEMQSCGQKMLDEIKAHNAAKAK